jgi:hypothetical protein
MACFRKDIICDSFVLGVCLSPRRPRSRRDPEEPAFLVQLHAVSCNSASIRTALIADIKHRVLAMASGYGAKGQVGRCYPFWMDIQKCLATANSPNECALQKEVSPMDRAVGQGGSQM